MGNKYFINYKNKTRVKQFDINYFKLKESKNNILIFRFIIYLIILIFWNFWFEGAGGDFYFTFEAVAKTSEPVSFLFSYQKPWEGINDVANAVKVEITVN